MGIRGEYGIYANPRELTCQRCGRYQQRLGRATQPAETELSYQWCRSCLDDFGPCADWRHDLRFDDVEIVELDPIELDPIEPALPWGPTSYTCAGEPVWGVWAFER